MPISDAGHLAGMKEAAVIIADGIWKRARDMVTKTGTDNKIPPTINSYVRGGIGYVTAGGPGGLAAPNAAMFETPGARHPLFAKKPRTTPARGGWKRWYVQPYRPFMEEGAEDTADEAANTYADIVLETWIKESGGTWK